MNRLLSILLFSLLALFFSCKDDEPSYPIEPSISLKDMSFHEIEDDIDFLEVVINFKDGDKDLGLSADDVNFPFNPTNFFVISGNSLMPVHDIQYRQFADYSTGTLISFTTEQTGKLATLSTRKKPGFSSMPPNEYPYSCLNYIHSDKVFIAKDNLSNINSSSKILDEYTFDQKKYVAIEDTFYIEINKNYYNIFVDFLVKDQDDSEFKIMDWRTITQQECGSNFYDRIPPTYNLTTSTIETGPFTIKMNSPYEGEIHYKLWSDGFRIILPNSTIKLRIYIKDRALHDSNVIETEEFTLDEIME